MLGEFKDGEYNGQGTLHYILMEMKYMLGNSRMGKYHGQGTITLTLMEKKYEGEVKEGELWNGIWYKEHGLQHDGEKWVNGVIQGMERPTNHGQGIHTSWFSHGETPSNSSGSDNPTRNWEKEWSQVRHSPLSRWRLSSVRGVRNPPSKESPHSCTEYDKNVVYIKFS